MWSKGIEYKKREKEKLSKISSKDYRLMCL